VLVDDWMVAAIHGPSEPAELGLLWPAESVSAVRKLRETLNAGNKPPATCYKITSSTHLPTI
jgi:hypothetical protein